MADPTIIIDAEPDWRELPEIGYAFDTVVQTTPRFVEQRRPLLSSPVRSLSCKLVLDNQKAENLLNILLSAAPQLCCVPIYSEPVFASTITQGASSITIDTDLTYLWNIQNCTYLILLDYVTGASEMLKVDSVAGQVVSLTAAIIGSWTAAQTVIYPAMASVLNAVKETDHSSTHRTFDAEFIEIQTGEEATEEWVGFDERLCPPDIVPESPLTCNDYPFTGMVETDPDNCLTWSGNSLSVVNPTEPILRLAGTGVSLANPWFRFKLTITSRPSSGSGVVFSITFSASGEVNPASVRCTVNTTLVTIEAYGPSGSLYGGETLYDSPPFSRWLQVRFEENFVYVDVYTDEDFQDLETTSAAGSTGWPEAPTVNGVYPIVKSLNAGPGLSLSISEFSVCYYG